MIDAYTTPIVFESGGVLVRDPLDLPRIPDRIERLVADFETSSGDPRKRSINPWYDCTAIGVAVKFNRSKETFFIPRELLVTGWWADVIRCTHESDGVWANQNVKYDMHVSANDLGVVVPKHGNVRCTLTGAKLLDSDRGFTGGYGLDALARDWLNKDISKYEARMRPYLERNGKVFNRDYGAIPLDILAEYACIDVDTGAELDDYIEANMPDESRRVWQTEQKITELLFRMERVGIRVDPQTIKIKQYQVLSRMLELDEELSKIVGFTFRPHVNTDCYDVLCGTYGLPVLNFTDETEDEETGVISGGNPSFDKDTLKKYLSYPGAPKDVVSKMLEYRQLNTFNALFLNSYGELHIEGLLHGSYNQMVRTGRMSCSSPNMQQLSGVAKELILPLSDDYVIVSADFSQIEFRLIVHYIENRRCIDAYAADPWTDFHQWVADMVPTKRKPAKTINFMMGYGGGMRRTIESLSINDDVVGEVVREVDASGLKDQARQAAIVRSCQQRARQVYRKYHELLPELKPTTRAAENVCRARGFARNLYGRRRRLPGNRAHTAFNTLCQSSAGDMIKERMIALDRDERTSHMLQCAQVHDQVLGYVHKDLAADERTFREICDVMNTPSIPLRVPVRTSIGWSALNWKDAQSDERERKFK